MAAELLESEPIVVQDPADSISELILAGAVNSLPTARVTL